MCPLSSIINIYSMIDSLGKERISRILQLIYVVMISRKEDLYFEHGGNCRMGELQIEVVRDECIEQCRELCNELMAFQKARAKLVPEAFDSMSFDTRMKQSFNSALASYVAVVKDDGKPVGYVFSTVESVKAKEAALPAWAPKQPGKEMLGFYPQWDKLPEKAGCINNLYFRGEYRGRGLGQKLMDMSMDWFNEIPCLNVVFVYVSNGNSAALDFYQKYGFTCSHEVFGGFIQALHKKIK